MKQLIGVLCLFTTALFADAYDAVVKIYQTRNSYDYESPWSPPFQEKTGGSGFVIEGNRILTNAHVVADGVFIQIKKPGDETRYEATVDWIGHDCDLALLHVTDAEFFDGIEPLGFASEIAAPQAEVKVVGYPIGGEYQSVTKGIVSRTELHRYAFSGKTLLCSQVDSPINSGNSGGPVLEGHVVVGVAHQFSRGGENIGYMIPIPVITHFLNEVKEKKYHGFPSPNFYFQNMENKAIRSYYGLKQGETGVLVSCVHENSPFYKILKPGDVLLSIDGTSISNEGTVQTKELRHISLSYLLSSKYFDDYVDIELIRNKEKNAFTVPLDRSCLSRGISCEAVYNQRPTYFTKAGLVFQPLTLNYLASIINDDFPPFDILCRLKKEKMQSELNELVLLTRVLPDMVNVGYQSLYDEVVTEVNGHRIRSMNDLINAFETNCAPFHIILLDQTGEIVLDRELVHKRHKHILNNYFITSDRSEDLK